jgi:hypothetical protein
LESKSDGNTTLYLSLIDPNTLSFFGVLAVFMGIYGNCVPLQRRLHFFRRCANKSFGSISMACQPAKRPLRILKEISTKP